MTMNKIIAFFILLLPTTLFAQQPRTDAFHEKYQLKEVVVMSRHNIRSPLSTVGSPVNRVTPHQWKNWTAPAGELSLRGGVLETAMGQFFRQWVVSEGLLPNNYIPIGDEVFFYANSLQRTFATAKYFSAGFLPYANVTINRRYNMGKMDPVFTPKFTKMSDAYRKEVIKQMNAMGGKEGYRSLMNDIRPQLELMATVVDLAHSPACLEGDTCRFFFEDSFISVENDDEPHMHGGYALANSVADALVLQYYETEDSIAAAFGYNLTPEQWRHFGEIKSVYDDVLFTTPVAAVNLAHPLVSRIHEELNNNQRKFVFLCGHDSNLASLRGALGMVLPETKGAIEPCTPIGSKYVFEKWTDGQNDYLAVNLVYQSVDQLRHKTELSPENPPMVLPITLSGLTPNADGLYPFKDANAHFERIIKAYDTLPGSPVASDKSEEK